MFGLKKNPGKKGPFEFDLEKDLKRNPKLKKDTLELARVKTEELKGMLREGAPSTDYDDFGLLLQGYSALETVLNRMED